MAGVNFKPHPYTRGRGGHKQVDYRNAQHYIRLASSAEGAYTLYIQKGKVMTEDGDVIPSDKLPAWAIEAIKACNPQALREVGFNNEEMLAEIEATAREKSKNRAAKKAKIERQRAEVEAKKPTKGKKPPAKKSLKQLAAELPEDETPAEDEGNPTDSDSAE